jgi:hypothetical protein
MNLTAWAHLGARPHDHPCPNIGVVTNHHALLEYHQGAYAHPGPYAGTRMDDCGGIDLGLAHRLLTGML